LLWARLAVEGSDTRPPAVAGRHDRKAASRYDCRLEVSRKAAGTVGKRQSGSCAAASFPPRRGGTPAQHKVGRSVAARLPALDRMGPHRWSPRRRRRSSPLKGRDCTVPGGTEPDSGGCRSVAYGCRAPSRAGTTCRHSTGACTGAARRRALQYSDARTETPPHIVPLWSSFRSCRPSALALGTPSCRRPRGSVLGIDAMCRTAGARRSGRRAVSVLHRLPLDSTLCRRGRRRRWRPAGNRRRRQRDSSARTCGGRRSKVCRSSRRRRRCHAGCKAAPGFVCRKGRALASAITPCKTGSRRGGSRQGRSGRRQGACGRRWRRRRIHGGRSVEWRRICRSGSWR
jgi:hypothetical protein